MDLRAHRLGRSRRISGRGGRRPLLPDHTCRGQFSYSAEFGDAGNLRCSDGARASFQFQRLSLMRGYGTGTSSRGAMSFTYGLSADESEPYLKLPPGKALRLTGKELLLTDVKPLAPL
jgi:hypothetical protein